MFSRKLDLETGDLIEILYRVWRRVDEVDRLVERWVRAEIIDHESDTWPLARLADGQLTEVRPFMTWRHLVRAAERCRLAA